MLAEVQVAYADTSASALRWSLETARLRHLASQTFRTPRLVVEALVIGQSHQVVVDGPDVALIETVACAIDRGAPLPDTTALEVDGGRYSFRSRVQVLDADGFRLVVDDLVAASRRDADVLVARFPGDDSALTAIHVTIGDSVVGWTTWHAYPQRFELVETSTELDLR